MVLNVVTEDAFAKLNIMREKAEAALDYILDEPNCACAQMLVDIACDYLAEMGKMIENMQESRIKIPRWQERYIILPQLPSQGKKIICEAEVNRAPKENPTPRRAIRGCSFRRSQVLEVAGGPMEGRVFEGCDNLVFYGSFQRESLS